MNWKITTFMIGIVVAGLFMAGISSFLAEIDEKASHDNYNSSKLAGLNQTKKIYNISKQIEDRHSTAGTDPAWYDILGNLAADALDSITIMFTSYSAFNEMVESGGDTVGIPNVYISGMTVIIIIIILIGVFVSAKLKWQL